MTERMGEGPHGYVTGTDQPRESVVSAVHGAGCRTGLLE